MILTGETEVLGKTYCISSFFIYLHCRKRFNSYLTKNTACFHKQGGNNSLLFVAPFVIPTLCGQISELLVLRNVVRMFTTEI